MGKKLRNGVTASRGRSIVVGGNRERPRTDGFLCHLPKARDVHWIWRVRSCQWLRFTNLRARNAALLIQPGPGTLDEFEKTRIRTQTMPFLGQYSPAEAE